MYFTNKEDDYDIAIEAIAHPIRLPILCVQRTWPFSISASLSNT